MCSNSDKAAYIAERSEVACKLHYKAAHDVKRWQLDVFFCDFV